ncbi:MAG TPA: hypothetical protein VEB42_10755, partial [Chitinophagaceae bacterium]|nr:hypothetical protein [Chitinophagaceae bacterium]
MKKVLDKLNGYAYRQEYLCLADEPFTDPLQAYIVNGDNVTQQHLFVGYCPLIFAFPRASKEERLEMRFMQSNANALASLELRKINQQGSISYFEGTSAHHHFLPRVHQWINGLNNRLYQQKLGNVYLDNRLYPQVQTAYALPRRISLISLQLNGGFNLFPTDLHGQINPDQYIISLRHAGMACK